MNGSPGRMRIGGSMHIRPKKSIFSYQGPRFRSKIRALGCEHDTLPERTNPSGFKFIRTLAQMNTEKVG
jgi:hypothetical protein